MKKIIGIAAILVLIAGISHAGDSFSIVIGPHGFGFQISGGHLHWQPKHPRYYADWRPIPYRRLYRQPRQGHYWNDRQPLSAPYYRQTPPRQRPLPDGNRLNGPRGRRR